MQPPLVDSRPQTRLYDLGVRRNLQQVFGRNCLWALLPVDTRYASHDPSHNFNGIPPDLPIHSEGDGASYPLRHFFTRTQADVEMREVRSSSPSRSLPHNRGLEGASEEESEVELFAAGMDTEMQPLTQHTEL